MSKNPISIDTTFRIPLAQCMDAIPTVRPLRVADSLEMQMEASSCPHDIWNTIIGCLHAVWKWIYSHFKAEPPPTPLHLTANVDPTQHPHTLTNPNKVFAYNLLTHGKPLGAPVTVQKFSLGNLNALKNQPLFTLIQPVVTAMQGGFAYEPSTADTVHWTANFADSSLFAFCGGSLLAQDELQVLEHPALAHIKNGLSPDMRTLDHNDVALFQNVERLGHLDTTNPLPNGQTLYGNQFAAASQAEVQSRLHPFAQPTSSNIFAMSAPHIHPNAKDLPYEKQDLEKLFFTAFNAFSNIKKTCAGKRVVVHTGNWGAGAFGNDPKTVQLIQLAAARYAEIDEIKMYPLNYSAQLAEAMHLLNQIEHQNAQINVGQFLDHLEANAVAYNLRYKEGNGT